MTEADKQREALETLKSFNNATVNIRMYPAMAPQVTNAVERGYKAVKLFLRNYGDFVISRQDRIPILCGVEIPDQVVQSISNLIVFRQLETLGLHLLAIKSGIDRHTFGQLLFMFTARVEKIKREGGGREFAANLQLEEYFPEEYQFTPGQQEAAEDEESTEAFQLPHVREDYLACLFGEQQVKPVVDELKALLLDPEKAAQVLAAGVAHILLDVPRQKMLVASSGIVTMFENMQALIETKDLRAVARHAAALLISGLKEPAFTVLLAQRYPEGFGILFFDALVNGTDTAVFGSIVEGFRKNSATLRLTSDKNVPQLQWLTDTLSRLLGTDKGRHFLGLEKAKNIIESGEKDRQSKRVYVGLQSLLLGNLSGLQNDELVMGIPGALQQMLAESKNEEVTAILIILNDQLRDGDVATQARIIRSMAVIGENLVDGNRWDVLAGIADSLLSWFRSADKGDFVFEKITNILQVCMSQAWKKGDVVAGDKILETFFQIRTGMLKKPPPVKALVDRVQDKGVDKTALPQLLSQCLENPTNELIGRRLVMQGAVVVRFLLDALVGSDKTPDRIKIIDLLTYTGQILPPILLRRLPEPMPWYGKRNLIKLLAETGGERHVDDVMPFLSHEDLRVQREAFVCLYKISGKSRKQVLLKMLTEANEVLKSEVIKALIPFCDEEVAVVLGDLLEGQEHFSPDIRDALLIQICQVLGRCNSLQTLETLQKFLRLKGKRSGKKIGQGVWAAAEEAAGLIEMELMSEKKRHVQVIQLRKEAVRKATQAAQKIPSEKKTITGLQEEQTVRSLLARGKVDSAKKQVMGLIGRMARLRKFNQAEQLRDWLIEIDAMALSEIIRAAELIEEEKRVAIDKGHIEVWTGLYDVLTTEEFSTLYHCLEHRRYENEEVIVSQGALQTSLFFINSGKVKLFFREEGSDVLVKTMIRGEVIGAGDFFDASVWTLSAASLGSSELSALRLENLEHWKGNYPALESKLNDFCRNFERIDQFFKKPERDRRKFKRTMVSGRITASLLNDEGQNTGVRTKGDLSDVSAGGVSFFIRISKKENARLLLGRGVRVLLPGSETAGQKAGRQGVIVAVRGYHVTENEYSVHVRFDALMHHHELQGVLQLALDGGRAGV